MHPVIGRLVALAAAALLPACATVTRSATRVAPPSDPQGTKRSSVTLSFDRHLRAELRTTDAVSSVVPASSGEAASPPPAAPPLGLALRFETRLLGYSFDPGQVVLRDGQGGEWRPAWTSVGTMKYGECQDAGVAGGSRGVYTPLVDGSCVLVQFDRAIGAGDRLELVVGGAALGQRRLEPLTVSVARIEQSSREPSAGTVGVARAFGKVLGVALQVALSPLMLAGL